MRGKRGKNNNWYFPTKEQIEKYKQKERDFWEQEDESWGVDNNYLDEVMIKESKQKRVESVYAVVSKERAYSILVLQSEGLPIDIKEENGILGNGIYFYGNREYANYMAYKQNKVVIGVKVNLENSLDINKGGVSKLIDGTYKEMKVNKKEIKDGDIIDEVYKKRKKIGKKDSSIIYYINDGNRLNEKSKLYRFTSLLVCVKDIKMIEKWYRLDLSKK